MVAPTLLNSHPPVFLQENQIIIEAFIVHKPELQNLKR